MKLKLKRVGFFEELRHGRPDGSRLKEAVSPSARHPESARITSYLARGAVLQASPGLVRDVLAEGSPVIGGLKILTDGTWAWPSDLPHYVERYHARLPEAFVEHMAKSGWEPPVPELGQLPEMELEP